MQEKIKKVLGDVKDTPVTEMSLSDDTDIINGHLHVKAGGRTGYSD